MSQLTRVFVAVALTACCSVAIGATAIRDYGSFGTRVTVEGVVAAPDGTHVVLADSTSGPVLIRIGVDNSVVRAANVNRFHVTSLAKTSSGFLVAGGSKGDVPWLMSLNEKFEVNWAETLDGDFLTQAISAANDGSIYLGGYRAGDSKTAALIKLAADGSISWRRTVHGSGDADQITAVLATNDGVVAAGSTACGASLWKILSDGTFAWQRCFSAGRLPRFSAVTAVDDGFVAVGQDDASMIVVKTNGAGLFRWRTVATGKHLAFATGVAYSKDQIVVIGLAEEISQGGTLLLAALAPDGKLVWQRSYGSPGETSAIADSRSFSGQNAAADRDGGVVAAVGIGDSLRVLRFHRDGSTGDDCSDVRESTLSFLASPPFGPSTAVEVQPFDATAHRIQHKTGSAVVSSSTPACSAAPKAATSSGATPQSEQKQDRLAVYKQTSDLLMARKFAELDALADEWRRTRARVEPLSPNLLMLYDSVAGEMVSAQIGGDEQEKLLKDWIAARPSSATAVLALARYYNKQAGEKRGESFTVSEKGSEESQRYNEASLKLLREHQELAAVDPQYYATLIGATQDGSRYFQLGTAQSDIDVIGAAAIFLLPQWGGTPEQYQRLMETAVARTKDDLGQTMYARLAIRLVQMACCDDKSKLWDTYHLDMSRIKQGCFDWSDRASSSPVPLHRLAILAYGRQDRALLAELFNRDDMKWDNLALGEWGTRQFYDSAHSWALPKISNLAKASATPSDPRTWPQVLLDSDITLTNGGHRRLWAFLVNTPDGVAAVSSLVPFWSANPLVPPISDARNGIQTWKIARPTLSRDGFLVSGYVTPMTSFTRGVVLSVPPFKGAPLVRPLDVAEASIEMQRKVFVAACLRSEANCKQQHMFEGRVISTLSGDVRQGKLATKTFHVQIEGATLDDVMGAPVLDEGGFAVGVVLGGAGEAYGKPIVECDDLPFLVNNH